MSTPRLLVALVSAFVVCGAAAGAQTKTAWLCRPGQLPDPCSPGLSTTVYSSKLSVRGVEYPRAMDHPSVLPITPVGGAQKPTASPDPSWGLHLLHANIALGDLIGLVKSQLAAFAHRR